MNTLGVMGVYQDGLMKDSVNGKDVQAHLFEYTTQMCIDTVNIYSNDYLLKTDDMKIG